MEFDYMTGAVESILFASGEPIDAQKMAQALETDVKALDLEGKINEVIRLTGGGDENVARLNAISSISSADEYKKSI